MNHVPEEQASNPANEFTPAQHEAASPAQDDAFDPVMLPDDLGELDLNEAQKAELVADIAQLQHNAVIAESQQENTEEEEEEDYSQYTKDQLLKISQDLLAEPNLRVADKKFRALKAEMDRHYKEEREAALQRYVAENENEEGFEFKTGSDVFDQFRANFRQFQENRKKQQADQQKNREANLKAKQAILEELKALVDHTGSAHSTEKAKELQKRWKEIGPVPKDDSEQLYQSYHALLDRFYDNVSLEREMKELDRRRNLEQKNLLCEKAEQLTQAENVNEALEQLTKLHDEYRNIGPVPKEEKEKLWDRFKKASDIIYERKRAYAEEFKKQLKDNMAAKQEYCSKVEEFAAYTSDRIKDWNVKTKELLDLQAEWEKIGPLPKEVAKSINKQFWTGFKQFFANKNKFFEAIEAQRSTNLAAKVAICEQAEALKDSTEWDATTEAFKKLQEEWKEVGPVPESQREKLYERFKAACDHFFERRRNRKASADKEFDDNYAKKLALCRELEALAKDKVQDVAKAEDIKARYMAIGFVPRNKMNDIQDHFVQASDKFFDQLSLKDEERELQRLKFQSETFKGSGGSGGAQGGRGGLDKKEGALRKKIQTLENDIALWQNNLEFFANSKMADALRSEFNVKIEEAQQKIKALKSQLKVLRQV